MPDDVLRVTTTVDLAPLLSGMNTAASVVESSTSRMNGAFAAVANSTAQWDVNLQRVAVAAQKQGAAAVEDSAAVKVLQEQITILNAKLVELEEKLQRAPRTGSREFMEARHAIMGMGEEIGVRLPRFVTTFLSHLEGVAPIMAAAFSAVAIIGIIQAIPELINKIFEMTDALAGWDAEAKKAYANQLEMNRQLYMETVKQREAHLELATVGLTGQKKLAAEMEAARGKMAMLGGDLRVLNNSLGETQKKSDDIHKSWTGIFTAEAWKIAITGSDETKDALERQKKTIFELTQQWREFHDAVEFKIPKEQSAEAITEQLAASRATADAMKSVQMASLSFQEQSAKEMLAAGIINHAQELAALRSAEEQKYTVEKEYIERRKRLALEEQAKTGKSAAPELTTFEGEREALEVQHQAKMSAITTTGEAERRRMEDEAERATIEGDRKVADARVMQAESAARELRAARKISIDEEHVDLVAAENQRFTAETTALNKELDLAKKYPEKNASQIIAMQKQLEAAEINHKAKLASIDATYDEQRLSETRRRMMEEVRYQQESANIQLQMAREQANMRLKVHEIGLKQWQEESLKAVDTWYASEKAALEKELIEAKKIYGENSIEYKKLMDKLRLLDQERLKEVTTINDQIGAKLREILTRTQDQINGTLSRVMAGYESWSKAWDRLWEQMSTTAIKNLLKMMEQEMLALLLHKAMGKDEVLTDAKIAAANTYKAVSAIPYVGPFLAPPAAAAAFAAVMAFGSFQRGGETGSQETMAHLHPREMVLGENIATPLKAMLGDYSAISGRMLPVIAGTGISSVLSSTLPVSATPNMLRMSTSTGIAMPSSFGAVLAGRGGEGGPGGAGGRGGDGRSLMGSFLDDPVSSRRFRMLMADAFHSGEGGSGDARSRAGSAVHMHYSPTMHSYGSGFGDMLEDHAHVVVGLVKRAMRDGAFE